jgi:type I restriction enzyme R subunit
MKGKAVREMLGEYQSQAETDQIHIIAQALGVDEEMLRELVRRKVDESTIDDRGGFEKLVNTANLGKAKECFEGLEHQIIHPLKVKIKVDGMLRRFLFADDAGKEAIAKEIANVCKVENALYEEYEPEMLMAAEGDEEFNSDK